MSQQAFLTALVRWLDMAGVEYYLTGSIASGIHGEPRATHDIDLVVTMPPGRVADLAAAFPGPRYYLDRAAAAEGIRRGASFNLIDSELGLKADFWMQDTTPFARSAMARRVRVVTPYGDLWVASPEDTILSKLSWAKRSGGSEQQMRDVRKVFEVTHATLDQGYLDAWAPALGVGDLLARTRAESKPV